MSEEQDVSLPLWEVELCEWEYNLETGNKKKVRGYVRVHAVDWQSAQKHSEVQKVLAKLAGAKICDTRRA